MLKLIDELIALIHKITSHAPSAASITTDAVTTAETVVGVVPQLATPEAQVIATAVNSALNVASTLVPASANPEVELAIHGAEAVAEAITKL